MNRVIFSIVILTMVVTVFHWTLAAYRSIDHLSMVMVGNKVVPQVYCETEGKQDRYVPVNFHGHALYGTTNISKSGISTKSFSEINPYLQPVISFLPIRFWLPGPSLLASKNG